MTRVQLRTILILGLLLVSTAVAIVWAQFESRRAFQAWQQVQAERDVLSHEWQLLQLELATLSAPARIERLAAERLALRRPSAEEIVVIRGQR